MATYIMMGKYSPDALGKISADRTKQASALVEANGGALKAVYALLGETDIVAIVDLPDTQRAMKTGIGLSRLLGISFSTMPALPVEEFDRLMG